MIGECQADVIIMIGECQADVSMFVICIFIFNFIFNIIHTLFAYTFWHAIPTYSLMLLFFCTFEQSNRTPRCSKEVSAEGLPWLEHFRVQCYT